MATNYPGSLDAFVNPASGNTLDSPSHSLQHSDINDAVEALETKLGVGTATPGTATAFFPLVAGTAGETSWTQLTAAGITSGTATSGQVLAANGSGAVSFTTPTVPGLVQIVPSSVAVGSGSGSANANGAVTFTSASSVSLNGVFSSTYDHYRVLCVVTAASTEDNLNFRLRASGTDNSTASSYQRQLLRGITSTVSTSQLASNLALISQFGADTGATFYADFFNPFLASSTRVMSNFMSEDNATSVSNYIGMSYTFHNQSTSYDGFSLIPLSGNITGTISVYGYRD
jgi:hypothetical protein